MQYLVYILLIILLTNIVISTDCNILESLFGISGTQTQYTMTTENKGYYFCPHGLGRTSCCTDADYTQLGGFWNNTVTTNPTGFSY